MFNVIVVGTDGSATADAAVKRAGQLAEMSGARIELVGGFRESYAFASGLGADTYPADLAKDAARGRRRLRGGRRRATPVGRP